LWGQQDNMDSSDITLKDFIDQKIDECLQSDSFANLDQSQKNITTDKLKTHLYSQVFDTIVDNLNDEQAKEVENLPFEDPTMQQRLQRFLVESPDMIYEIEDKVLDELDTIKQSGVVPQVY